MKEMKFIVRSDELIICNNSILPITNTDTKLVTRFKTIGEAMKKAIQVNNKLKSNKFKVYSIFE